jgi:thiol-disulfide isomerase/thioredoxin
MRRGLIRLAWAVPILVAAGLAGCGDSGSEKPGDASKPRRQMPPPPPKPSAPFEPVGATIGEVEAAVAEHEGKVVLVDFWATWCGPCVKSFPKLVGYHTTYAPKGLVVLAVTMDDPGTESQVREFLKRQGADFPCYLVHPGPDRSADGEVWKDPFRYQGGIPHTVLFNKAGSRAWAGHPESVNLDKKIEAELAK